MSKVTLLGRPIIEKLPDDRRRITRFHKVNAEAAKTANLETEVFAAYGAADVEFTGARLIQQRLERRAEQGLDITLVQVYEELSATAETQVGENTAIKLEDGRTAAVAEFIQLSAAAATPGTVGTTTAPGDASAYLQTEEAASDGTLRRIKRTYVYAGTISTDDQSLNNGKLLKRTIVAVKLAPATPSGYTLVGTPVQHPNGLPVYTYTFYKGDGEMSREARAMQSGHNSTDGVASTGGTVWSIRHLTASSVSANPTSAPVVGAICISVDKTDQDGYRVWSVVWAYGTGIVETDTATREGGKLIIYHRVELFPSNIGAPSAPSATIGGTVVLIDAKYRQDQGWNIHDRTWAEGYGEAARSTRYEQSSDAGTTGATVITITHLTTIGASDPTISPGAGYVKVASTPNAQDGYLVWTVIYAKGTGTVVSTNDLRNKGKLVVYRRVALGSAPSAPSATIGGIVVSTGTSTREAEGFKVYDYTWAEGVGTIEDSLSYRNTSKLVIYRKTALGSAPSAPSATIGGTVVLIADDSRDQDGVTLYDRTWAEGKGVIEKRVQARDGGLRLETWVSLGTTYDAAFMLPAGILMAKDQDDRDGYTVWTVTCIQNAAGASPLIGSAVASFLMTAQGNTYYGSVPAVTVSGGGGSSAAGTAVLSGGTEGYVTSITLTNAGSGYTSPPTVVVGTPNGDEPQFAAVLTGVCVSREKLVAFKYPGRAKAVDLSLSGVANSHNLDIQLSPAVDQELIGVEEISYRTSASLSDLDYPLWAPKEWATVFAQYIGLGNVAVSKLEALPNYRTVGNVSSVSAVPAGAGLVSVLGVPVYYAAVAAKLKVFGGPDAPDGQTFTMEAAVELAFIGYDGTKYFRRTVTTVAVPPQADMPTLTAAITLLSSSVTSIATLKAVTTVGAIAGSVTNSFLYAWTQGGVIFTARVRPTLTSGALTGDTVFLIKPTDYSGGTPLYWTLTQQ